MRTSNHHHRNGITLLFVVSMIVLFLLMGTAFVVLAGDFFRTSRKLAQVEYQKNTNTQALLELALYEALRGPELSAASPLNGKDLLADMYGYGVRARIKEAQFVPNTGNQLIDVRLKSPNAPFADDTIFKFFDQTESAITNLPGIYSGLVFSIISKGDRNESTTPTLNETGTSTRIVRHNYDTTNGHRFLLPVQYFRNRFADDTELNEHLANATVVINGREFSNAGTLAGAASNVFEFNASHNEPYDAVNDLNSFLYGYPDGNKNNALPSFRDVNPNKQVDLDNDGIPDAGMIDLGAAPISGPDGKYYKPMFAYKIVDFDGRFDLNAHGNLADADTNYWISLAMQPMGAAVNNPPRGMGFGPPEISLRPIFSSNPASYRELLAGQYGRYGADREPGLALNNQRAAKAKLIGYPDTLVGGLFTSPMDLHGRFFMMTPQFAFDNNPDPGLRVDYRDFNFPMSFNNALPTIDVVTSTAPVDIAEFRNSPYSMSQSTTPSPLVKTNTTLTEGTDDAPFTHAELERVLRASDIDVNFLPDRLSALLGGDAACRANGLQDIVGVASNDVPVTPQSFDRLLLEHLRRTLLVENGNVGFASLETLTAAERDLLITRYSVIRNQGLFAPELYMGLKMNVNRPFGNGRDDDGNGLVDDPADTDNNANGIIDGSEVYERNLNEEAFRGGTINMDLNGDGIIDQNDTNANARTVFARQLYCLMMFFAFPNNNQTPEHAQAIAQWAVNVVDFRDSDSINTRFDYDPFPFDANGWTPASTVWGAERPELLITESFAAHARRTEQLRGGPNSPFEQRLRPEAFAFIELYNPWTQTRQELDVSLYAGNGNNRGVDLTKRSGAIVSGGVTSPVWRIRVDRPTRAVGGLPTIDPAKANSTPLRYVYFTHPDHAATTDTVGDDDQREVEVFYSTSAGQKLVLPGSQALVGTRGFNVPGSPGVYRNYFGRQQGITSVEEEPPGSLDLNNTQFIEVDENNLSVRHNPTIAGQPATRRVSTFVPITQARVGDGSAAGPRPFNVSDRFGGYPDVDQSNTPYVQISDSGGFSDGYRYDDDYNDPFDMLPAVAGDHNRDREDLERLLGDDGTAETFRVVRLERLADPTRPWDLRTNPYLVVDTMHMDLIAFNGVSPSADPMIRALPNPPDFVASRASGVERGADRIQGNPVPGRILWRSARDEDDSISPPLMAPTPPHYFNFQAEETLGMTNNRDFTPVADGTKGYPWLVWNNRPFVSQMELMYVPYFGQQPANENYSVRNLTDHFSAGRFEERHLGDRASRLFSSQENFPAANGLTDVVAYNHLIDFRLPARDQNQNPIPGSPPLEVIFDYLEVPSRFVGTERTLTPPLVGDPGAHNPFNHLSNYRVPGKVNLNTIFDPRVYQGVMGQHYSTGLNWNQFITDRNDNTGSNNGFYRSYDMSVAPSAKTPTLMRGQQSYISTNPHDDSERSAFFLHNQRQRLANLTTTRSNVYGIWIAVGFFECNADGSNVQLNNEMGADDGMIKRHRGYFVFDRSIPVAYEPGKNHNIDQAILVRRIIE